MLQPRFFLNPSSLARVVVSRCILYAWSVMLEVKPTSFVTIHEVWKITKITPAGKTPGQKCLIYSDQTHGLGKD